MKKAASNKVSQYSAVSMYSFECLLRLLLLLLLLLVSSNDETLLHEHIDTRMTTMAGLLPLRA